MTDHISSCSAINGDTDDTMSMKDIHIRGLTGLDTVGNNVEGRQSGFRTGWVRIKVAVGDLVVV